MADYQLGDFSGVADIVAPETAFELFGIKVSVSVVSGAAVCLGLIVFAAIVRIFVIPRFKMIPGFFQTMLEWLVEKFDNMSSGMGSIGKFLGPYTFGTAAYICFGVLIELVGVRPPIADINTCLALSLSTFFLINFFGIKRHGPIGRLKYYLKPNVVVAPFRLMSDLMVPVSMAIRLFASVLSGMLTMEIVYAVFPVLLPAVLSPIFTLFHAFIQAYIFAILTVTFIQEAAE